MVRLSQIRNLNQSIRQWIKISNQSILKNPFGIPATLILYECKRQWIIFSSLSEAEKWDEWLWMTSAKQDHSEGTLKDIYWRLIDSNDTQSSKGGFDSFRYELDGADWSKDAHCRNDPCDLEEKTSVVVTISKESRSMSTEK